VRVLVTGAKGFVGKNLLVKLAERGNIEIVQFTRESPPSELAAAVDRADFIFHLAGVNRPQDPSEFAVGNTDLTHALCDAVKATGRAIPIVYTSSIQAERDNPYGISKRLAEQALLEHQEVTASPIYIYRLSNVFGKWCRPNYNSAVATFCHNIARDLPITINDPAAMVELVYIDDVIAAFTGLLNGGSGEAAGGYRDVAPVYRISVGALADQIHAFKNCRHNLVTERVGTGLTRALYATYVSYLPPASFSYTVPQYGDPRGVFVEMLKTPDCGQFSYFTAHPGITRGGHYHHSKTEKFLVIKGKARFGFRHIATDEYYALETSGEKPEIVETVPGWTHDITNIGDDEMIVMLWANEIFDREHPDTYARPVQHEKT
jgi:UDP-2-acetamido-2,6-beta-L-arabino-hexul-4-ose reductase